MCQDQWVYFVEALPDHDWFATVDSPTGANPTNAIFYRRDAFERLSAGGYWLSETPHVSGSRSWKSSFVRLANWIRLREKTTGIDFRMVNTHLDHISALARAEQARVLCEDSLAYPVEYPQVLTGDMNNNDETQTAIGVFLSSGWIDSWAAVHGDKPSGLTYHEYLGDDYAGPQVRIDWVFTRGRVAIRDSFIIRDSRDGRYPSDHYFVGADIALRGAPSDAS